MGNIAVDIETFDPYIDDTNNGAILKGRGYENCGAITSIGLYDGTDSIAVRPDDPRLKDWLASEDTKIFHNGVYDLDWLVNGYGYKVNGKIEDTLTRAALIDSQADSYTLDDCCKRFNIKGKNYNDTVELWWKEQGLPGKAIKNMCLVPFDVQAKYVQQDAKATYDLFTKQQNHIKTWGLQEVNDLEAGIVPVIMDIRRNGCRLSTDAITGMSEEVHAKLDEALREFTAVYGDVNLRSSKQVGELMHSLGVTSPVATETGAESWSEEVLNAIEHPIAAEIKNIRIMQMFVNNVLDNKLNKYLVDDHIYSTLKATKREHGGAATGRFSSSDPNMQNISARKDKFGAKARALFIPEEDCLLASFDYSQIEFRFFASLAVGQGAEAVRKDIRENNTDYHNFVLDIMGWTKDKRDLVKSLNFGTIYGMGVKTFVITYGHTFKELARLANKSLINYAMEARNEYFRRLPFVRQTFDSIVNNARNIGYAHSFMGRLFRLKDVEKAYKMVNWVVQGSAADILKTALYKAYKAGVWNVLKLHMLIHDEFLFSIPRTREAAEACKELEQIMVDFPKLSVPMSVGAEAGANWFDTSREELSNFYKEYL